MTQAERITALETEVRNLKEVVKDMDTKLDTLLALRNKGAGVFWLATTIFGTSIAGVIVIVSNWIKM